MEPAVKIDKDLFKEIDKTSLNEKRLRWKAAVKNAPYKVHVDRQKYATESWKQTEGEDLETRRAKLFEHVVKNIEISILDFDYIVGRMGPTVVGAYTAMDICGDYLEGIWSDEGSIQFSMHDKSGLTQEELEVLRDAARAFRGKTVVDMGNKVMEDGLGSWPQDALEARLKDPQLTSGNFGNSTNTIDFEKIINRGLKYFIAEAQGHIDDFIANQHQYPDKIYFWKAAIIVALGSNFEGERGAEIQKMCLESPKFGNDIDEVDNLARRVSILSADSVTSWDNSPYPHFISLREGLSWHYFAGLGVGALPSGRKALEPLNDGSASPMRGMDKKGPTAVLRSVIKANFGDHSYVQALNQKFPRNMVESDDSIDKMVAYTNAFLGAGGTHIQYNLVDTEEMKEAQIKPDEYRDLIVRVGGFSAYFVQLSQQIQDDIILRSEHNL